MLHHTALIDSKTQNTKTRKGLVKRLFRKGLRREQHKDTQRRRIHTEARVGKHKRYSVRSRRYALARLGAIAPRKALPSTKHGSRTILVGVCSRSK